jgi:hypothetical protein
VEVNALEWIIWGRLRDEVEVTVATVSRIYFLIFREIQARHPDLSTDVRRVYRVRYNILDRLIRDLDIQKLLRQTR